MIRTTSLSLLLGPALLLIACSGDASGSGACVPDECGANAACSSGSGDSAHACVCSPGWEGDGRACTDVDECAAGTDGCDANATCANTDGGWECDCNEGWEGDGRACTDVDECAAGTDGCDGNATCANTDGGWECDCNEGWEGDGRACTPLDACVAAGMPCTENAECFEEAPSPYCRCADGFAGDGTVCIVPPSDCAALIEAIPGIPSGIYPIDPDGPDAGGAPVLAECDMDTDGGGWTRCSSAGATGTPAHEFRLDSGSNWYACDLLPAAPDGTFGSLIVRTENDAELHLDRFDGLLPNVLASSADDPEVGATIIEDTFQCSGEPGSLPGNSYLWMSGLSPRYGVTDLQVGCHRLPHWWLFSSATVSDGCTGFGQRLPGLAYACGEYDVDPISASLWTRPHASGSCGASCLAGEACANVQGSFQCVCSGPDFCRPPPVDCREVLERQPDASSGWYLIDPDGEGESAQAAVRCDMDSDGGGWTLCANAVTNAGGMRAGWGEDRLFNWFACDRLPATVFDELRVESSGGGLDYVDHFAAVEYNVPTPSSEDPSTSLLVFRDTAMCNGPSAGNFQFGLRSESARFGLSLRSGLCGSEPPHWFSYSPGTATSGCLGANQMPPYAGVPCDTYGDIGVSIAVWARATP